MKKILLLSLTTLISFNTIADYKVYGSQKNSLPIPKERPLFEQKISFESDESHDNLSISGYFIKRSNPEINTIPIEPTDGNIILAPYRPGNQWGEFYTYITFTKN